MIACVYIKDGNIHFYNERKSLSNIGGIAYELGRPLLDFVCYEPDSFEEGFSMIASAFDDPYAYIGAKEPEFINEVRQLAGELQKQETYVYLYKQMFFDFINMFIESPGKAVLQLADTLPSAGEKLGWVMDSEWPNPPPGKIYADSEKRLYRAAMDVVRIMSENLKSLQSFIIHEIEVLLHYREAIAVPREKSMDYLDILEEYHQERFNALFYLEKPFRTFYGRTNTLEIAELYEVNTLEGLFRFEFIKMIEHDIFIKKCKNCERFFIPRRRVDADYCDRIYHDTNRKCSEIGAMLRYEKKVAENPILEAHKKAYRRFHSRTRSKKMTQTEFLKWSEEASRKRDKCLAGDLPFEDFIAWLEQGRMRKARNS